jgi:hypothetical protein
VSPPSAGTPGDDPKADTLSRVIASFSLVRYPREERRWAFGRMGLDRADLSATPGLRFRRLVGTARGRSFAWKPDLLRWGLVAAWDDAAALDAFLATSPVAERWREHASEVWTVRMIPVKSAGRWGGGNPFPAQEPPPGDGPYAVITRATLKPHRTRRFYGAVPPIDLDLARADGLVASVGFGESPLGRQGTLSLWRSLEEMTAFAYGTAAHREAMRRRQDEGWYSEELFARFRPIATEGTWDGGDPLAGLLDR